MADPLIQISWGELFDRLSILEIKQSKLASKTARALAEAQHKRLQAAAASAVHASPGLADLLTRLKAINETLWSIEDELRDHEARNVFDARVIELARGVYCNNDERSRIKHAIDDLLGSEGEPKEYTPYDLHSRKPKGAGSS